MPSNDDELDWGSQDQRDNIPRTVFSGPNPGGRIPQNERQGTFEARMSTSNSMEAEAPRPGVNALVDAGADLLGLIVYLRDQNTPLEIEVLRNKVIVLIKKFRSDAQAAGEEALVVDRGLYAIAATIDDLIMSKPWGTQSGWQHATLVGALGGEKIGGDRFFEFLEQAEQNPRRYHHLIELMHICLSLGFQGRYRHERRQASSKLEDYRRTAFISIDSTRGGIDETLSDRWKGAIKDRTPIREIVPFWLAASLSVLICAVLFSIFFLLVGKETSRAVAGYSEMPFSDDVGHHALVEIVRLDRADVPTQVVEVRTERAEVVQTLLEEEIAANLVEVIPDRGDLRIRLLGETMFASGKASIAGSYEPVLQRVAAALNERPGSVLIEGHTDSIPLKNSRRFPTNFHLSKARANAAALFMLPLLVESDRVQIQGLGDTVPLATNATREGRARNRRIEILLREDITSE